MSRAWDDRLGEYRELRARAALHDDLLARLRESEGVSLSPDSECDSLSEPSSSDSLRWESGYPSCCGPAVPPTPGGKRTRTRLAPRTPGRWQRMRKLFGKLILP
jgi:hypothetical protein